MLSWSPSLYYYALLGPLPLTPVFLSFPTAAEQMQVVDLMIKNISEHTVPESSFLPQTQA